MKNKIKAFEILFIIFALVVSSFNVYAQENAEDSDAFNEAYEILKAIDAVEFDKEYSLGHNMTRGEFAVFLQKAFKFETNDDNTYFSDIEDREVMTAVNGLYNAGIISMADDRMFNPNNIITEQEAVKMFVSVAGYSVYAMYNGGYPLGYQQTAHKLNYYDGTDGSGAVTYKNAVVMLFNVMESEYMTQYTFGENNRYSTGHGSVLYNLRKISCMEGKVVADEYTALSGRNSSGDGSIIVATDDGEEIIHLGDCGAENFIGFNVKMYVRHNSDDTKTLLYISKDKKTDELVISGEDITYASFSEIEHYNNGRKSKIAVELTSDVIYNGVVYQDFDMSNLVDNKYAEITFVSLDGKGAYDLIIVEEYFNYVVQSFNKEDGLIYNDLDSSVLELNEYNKVKLFSEDGDAEYTDIEANDVISVFADKDKKCVRIYISKNRIKGEISKSKTADGSYNITVNGNVYEVSGSDIDRIKVNGDRVKVGDGVELYLDYKGNIADVRHITGAPQYGYLMKAAEGSGVFDETAKIMVLTEYGDYKEYELTEKCKLNGIKSTGKKIVKGSEICPDGTFSHQLIRYTLNANGKVSEICTAKEQFDYVKNSDNNLLWHNGTISAPHYTCSNGVRTFARTSETETVSKGRKVYALGQQSVIFSVDAGHDGEMLDETMVRVMNNMTTDTEKNYSQVRFYDADNESGYAKIVLMIGNEIEYEKYLAGVNSIAQCVDESGEEYWEIDCVYNGQNVLYRTESDDVLSEIQVMEGTSWTDKNRMVKEGDIIQFSLNIYNEIKAIRLVSSIAETTASLNEANISGSSTTLLYGAQHAAYGIIKKFSENIVALDGSQYVYPLIVSANATAAAKVYKYDERNMEFYVADTSILGAGNKVIIHKRFNAVCAIFVLE